MVFKRFSFKWWWYGQVEDLHNACAKELRDLEENEIKKGHSWQTPKEDLPNGWYSIGIKSLQESKKTKRLIIAGPYYCIWESPEHVKIRCRYSGLIFQRRLNFIPQIVGVLGGLLGIISFFMQCLKLR